MNVGKCEKILKTRANEASERKFLDILEEKWMLKRKMDVSGKFLDDLREKDCKTWKNEENIR